MKRFLLLLLVVAVIITALAYVTNRSMNSAAAPLPFGAGEAAWLEQTHAPAVLAAVQVNADPVAYLIMA